MGPPAEARASAWWIDRSGRAAASVVLVAAAIAWAVLLSRPTMSMPGMDSMGMPAMMDRPWWSGSEAAAFVGAWSIMMAAMMLPSATPMIALYGTVSRARAPEGASWRTLIFAAPYAALWGFTGLPVYAASAWMAHLSNQHQVVHDARPYLVGATLVVAGGYQFSRLKKVCLAKCQNPITFLVQYWRPGAAGAVEIGLRHAVFCLGCCVSLMVVLVAVGSMGLVWVLLVAAAVFAEKVLPATVPVAPVTGVALIALGAVIVAAPAIASHL